MSGNLHFPINTRSIINFKHGLSVPCSQLELIVLAMLFTPIYDAGCPDQVPVVFVLFTFFVILLFIYFSVIESRLDSIWGKVAPEAWEDFSVFARGQDV